MTASSPKIHSREIGQVRIYLAPRERHPRHVRGWKRFLPSPPLYMDIIRAAKREAGILNASAHPSHYGYSNGGPLQQSQAEAVNEHLALCVELVGPRATLERFCREHGDLLEGKVILYKHLEHWSFQPHGLKVRQATRRELAGPLD